MKGKGQSDLGTKLLLSLLNPEERSTNREKEKQEGEKEGRESDSDQGISFTPSFSVIIKGMILKSKSPRQYTQVHKSQKR